MTVAKSPDVYAQGEIPSWAWPVHAFVAWLATVLGYIARFKRARRFASNWRDNWDGLRESEWHRDQLIAQGVAQLLAGQPLQLDDTQIQLTPPDNYGGPCPRTPFDMSRRFIALARWAADPEAIIRERFKRIMRAAHASTDAARRAAAQHELVGVARSNEALMLSRPQRGRPSKHERGLANARGPPEIPDCLIANSRLPRKRKLPGSPPLARNRQPAYPPTMCTRAATLRLQGKAIQRLALARR